MTTAALPLRSSATQSDRPTFFQQFFWSVLLSLYFFAIYGIANTVTAHRAALGRHIPTFVFDFERHIPFVPAMILPYMSIDLFFFAAPFFCATIPQLRTHAKRILLAITIAGTIFLLFPLRYAFVRPHPSGLCSPLFDLLYAYDHPYNLAPSLHIVNCSILWLIYIPRTVPRFRWPVRVWFLLIGLSTLLVYQHHLIDILIGQILAMLCFYLLPSPAPAPGHDGYSGSIRSDSIKNLRVALLYSLLTLALVALACFLPRPGVLLLWPAFATGMVAAGYWGLGPIVFPKTNGQLTLTTRWLLFPYFAVARLFHLHNMRRAKEPYVQVAPNVLLGRRLSEHEAARAVQQQRITAVLDLTAEFSEPRAFRELAYCNIPILDLTAPTSDQLTAAVSFIRDHARSGKVYVHCALGYSRAACIVAAYLVSEKLADSPADAAGRLAKLRPIILRSRARAALDQFCATC